MEKTETIWDRWTSFVHRYLPGIIALLLVMTLPTLALVCHLARSPANLVSSTTIQFTVLSPSDATTGRI